MQIELNIGLNVTNGDNSVHGRISRHGRALQFLRNSAYLASVSGTRLVQSATEETLVVKLTLDTWSIAETRQELFELAQFLEQDCVAVYNPSAFSGELVGPNAAAWGEFNPAFFIRLDAGATAQIYTPKAAAPAVTYTGHGATTGGLQGHSVGSDYPYMIVGVQDRAEAPTEWRVMDTRTSKMSDKFPTQQRAIIEMSSLRIRNCMHS